MQAFASSYRSARTQALTIMGCRTVTRLVLTPTHKMCSKQHRHPSVRLVKVTMGRVE
jgi:hypothetical protein